MITTWGKPKMFTISISIIIYNENSFMEKYIKIYLHYSIEAYK